VARDHIIRIDQLVWDVEAQHGQIRRLDERKVQYYEQTLLVGPPPVRHIEVYVRDCAGV